MTTFSFQRTLALTYLAPAAMLLPVVMSAQPQALTSAEAATLQARFDPSLGSLRAGGVATPAPLGTHERAVLEAAQQQSATLDALRAGAAPSNTEWGWIAVGAAIVLLIVLL